MTSTEQKSWFPRGLENLEKFMVPTVTGNQGKPGKIKKKIRENLEKWEGIFQSGKSQGILSRLKKSGNFTQNTGKIRKNYTGKLKRMLEKSGKLVNQ